MRKVNVAKNKPKMIKRCIEFNKQILIRKNKCDIQRNELFINYLLKILVESK